jgi:hypothetical protein
MANGKEYITKEDGYGTPYPKMIGFTAAHEIFHSWNLSDDSGQIEFSYGVMNYDDRRSYFHCDHIMAIRGGTVKFDQVSY